METSLKVRNIVLVGVFSPQQFDKYFFIKNNILNEEEIIAGSSFGGLGVQVITEKFNIVIGLGQIIFTSVNPEDSQILYNVASLLVKSSTIHCSAMGLNLHWYMSGFESPANTSQKLFYSKEIALYSNFFKQDDANFGAYASKDFKDARLKLDIKPKTIEDVLNSKVENIISFEFNFHFDVKNQSSNDELLNYLSAYSEYEKEGNNVMSIYQ